MVMIKMLVGLIICAFGIVLLFGSGSELRRSTKIIYENPWADPLIWFMLAIVLLLIGSSFLVC